MNWLITTSLQFRLLVIVLAVALIIVGVRTSDSVPLDVFPEFAPPLVEIQTEAPGIATEDVESLITVPIENAVNGIPFVQTVRSKSVLGLSSVRMIFNPGTDLIDRSAVGPRTTGARRADSCPWSLEAARDLAAAVVAQSLFEDRIMVGFTVTDGHDGADQVDDPPAADVDPWRGECRGLGREGTAAASRR